MCSKGQIKNTQIANNSRVRSMHVVNNLHDLRNTLEVEWNILTWRLDFPIEPNGNVTVIKLQ